MTGKHTGHALRHTSGRRPTTSICCGVSTRIPRNKRVRWKARATAVVHEHIEHLYAGKYLCGAASCLLFAAVCPPLLSCLQTRPIPEFRVVQRYLRYTKDTQERLICINRQTISPFFMGLFGIYIPLHGVRRAVVAPDHLFLERNLSANLPGATPRLVQHAPQRPTGEASRTGTTARDTGAGKVTTCCSG